MARHRSRDSDEDRADDDRGARIPAAVAVRVVAEPDDRVRHHRSLGDALRADVGRAIAMATGGALVVAPVEYALTLWTYAGTSSAASKLRLVALVATLALVLWLALAVALAATLVVVRLVRARVDPETAGAPGWFTPGPLAHGIRPGVPALWAAVGAAIGLGAAIQRGAAWAIAHYKEPQLTAALIAMFALAAAALARPIHRALAVAARSGAEALAALDPRLARLDPLGRWRPAGVALAALAGGGLAACWYLLPQSRSVLPVRLALSAIAIAAGMGLGALRFHRTRPRRRSRLAGAALAIAALGLSTATLTGWGADLETKYIAITASPALDKLIVGVRAVNDLDRDGFGSLLGEGDCAPFDPAIHPGAVDRPGDGVDQDCNGRDFSLADLVAPPGTSPGVPDAFKRDWNVLFITIDTVRYDRTTFGGYATGPKRRDTTPRLAELVRRATSFNFAQAPSAGTMASIPAILTSKFFHSGIAIDEKRPPGTPPGIMPENTTLPEIMKRAGYRTGVVASHEWWNGWGFEQGVDDYDNSIGRTADPYRVAADKVTDHSLAWISRQQGKKWFLWAHYIDPHGRYVAHPDVVDYGSSEPDLYDAELKWTDQQLGRLFDELVRLPSNENTIIVITSDHGDSMGEHSVPVGTHGTALYRELQHVPLIFYVPGNKSREVGGAVTNLDVVPTVAELCGIDISDLQLEGRSLVPALFYGREDHDRIVFAETNAPGKQRAAISEEWKLIFYLTTNVYELFDLAADPWEKHNLAPDKPPAFERMRAALDAWMNRVLYARDPLFNQAYRQMSDVILPSVPAPAVRTEGQTLDGGKLAILGIGPAAGKPLAGKTDVHVYFRATAPTAIPYRFQLVVWPVGPEADLRALPPTAVRTALRATADGAYPTDRWRAGDAIRERFAVTLPAEWTGSVAVGLYATDATTGAQARATGPAVGNDPFLLVLGVLPLGSSPLPHP
jgi:choline-sulfatase